MSDNTFNSSEIRAGYIEFMNAYDKCRKIFGLEDDFFKGKLFSSVLNEIRIKFFEIEYAAIQGIECGRSSDDASFSNSSMELHHESNNSSEQLLSGPASLNEFFLSLLIDFDKFENKKQKRIIFLLACRQIDDCKDQFDSTYKDHICKENDEDLFDNLYDVIKKPSIISKINERKIWSTQIADILKNDVGQALYLDKFYNSNLFDYLQKSIHDLFDLNAMIFPNKMTIKNNIIIFHCDAAFWKKHRGGLRTIEGADNEAGEYEYVQFKEPFLVLLDDNGNAFSKSDPNAKPLIVKFEKYQKKPLV